jgi:hypothetical protein
MMGTPAQLQRQRQSSAASARRTARSRLSPRHPKLRARRRQHVFEGQRLKVEAVTGVVVGGDGLGIAVDHDGLVAVFAQREGSMAAAIVELDPLPDAVGPAAQDDDFLARWARLRPPPRRSNCRGMACKLSNSAAQVSTRLNTGLTPMLLAQACTDFFRAVQPPQRLVSRSSEKPMRLTSRIVRGSASSGRQSPHFNCIVGNLLKLVQEPWIHRGHRAISRTVMSLLKGVANVGQPLGMRRHQALASDARLDVAAEAACPSPASAPPSSALA